MRADRGTRRTRTLTCAVAVCALGLVARLVVAAGTITLYVDDNSTCTTGCGSQAAPYRTIQAAIDDADAQLIAGAISEATVRVAAGNYPERLYIVPNVHVIGEGSATTVIDATGKGRAAVIFADRGGLGRPRVNFSIEGFKITGGIGEVRSADGRIAGGGIFILGDAVISNNLITGNVMSGAQPNWIGGGIYVGYGDPVITGNVISKNTVIQPTTNSRGIGGGIYVEGNGVGVVPTHARIEANTIAENIAQGSLAGEGGGIRVDGAPGTLVARNIIQNNRASLGGGGVYIYGTVNFTDNLVYGNSSAIFGGGVNIYQATAQITNTTIVGNTLTRTNVPGGYSFASYGGGMCVDALISQIPDPQVRITNTVLVGNTVANAGTTGGVFSHLTAPIIGYTDLWSNLRLPSNSENVGGDFVEAQVVGVNFNTSQDPRFAHAPLFSDVTIAAGTTTTVAVLAASRYSTNQKLEYNNDGAPRTITAINTSTNILTFTPALPAASVAFKVLANWGTSTDTTENFRLQSTSPLIDAGTNTPPGVPPSTLDLDGNPRVQDGNADGSAIIDLGPYEVGEPDTDGDGVPNGQDCAPLVFSVQTPPGPVGPTLKVTGGASATLRWDKISQANLFNVYRGSRGASPFTWNHVCLESGSTDRTSQDTTNPPAGSVFYYLISGVNFCAEGCLGATAPPGACEIPNATPCAIVPADGDGDSVMDLDDNCPLVANTTQVDQDHDGAGNACDNCPAVANPSQADVDANGLGDACQDADNDTYPLSVDCNDQNAAIHPGALEACNAVDDDCNGLVDEALGTTTCGTGACQRTVNNCVGGAPQSCTPGTPTTEVCNNIDDDCDGVDDDNLGSTTCGVGACQRTVNNCVAGVPQTCTPGTPSTEICNNIDDDCDGVVDDGLETTICGVGACQRTGPGCVNGVPGACTPGTPTTEVCNNIDDDCDGSVDNNLGTTTCGVGACQRTVNNCVAGVPQTCTPGTPSTEICNNIDDDCDGPIDEGFPNADGDGLADCVDPDDDNDGVQDAADNCPLIANPGQQNQDGDALGDACDNDADGDTYNKTASGSPIQTLASAEQRLQGTQAGNLASMQSSDNAYEAITEAKISNVSLLDMRWTFTVPAGHLSVVYVEAYKTVSTDGDDYQFAYSTDGTTFINMLVVSKTADDNLAQYFALPQGTSGTVTIRAQDTNRTSGNKLDTLFVDQIRITTSDPADCNDLAASVNPAVNEGPPGSPVCSDSVDNNCDGRLDANDANCR